MHDSLAELLDLSGKTAIVTGGAKGIGRGIAERLHEAGANVVVADLAAEDAVEIAEEMNELRLGSALAVRTDVSDKRSVKAMLAATVAEFDGVDILVNDAGIFPSVPFTQMDEDDFMKVINVNLRGVFLCTKVVADRMIEQGHGGKIINVTSIDALHPSMIGLAHYDASKHAVWGFTKNIALELAQYGIQVNAIAPGGVLTPGVEAMNAGATTGVIDEFAKAIPMHRLGSPDEMGRVAVFLASGLASYLTGSQIVADGGVLLT